MLFNRRKFVGTITGALLCGGVHEHSLARGHAVYRLDIVEVPQSLSSNKRLRTELKAINNHGVAVGSILGAGVQPLVWRFDSSELIEEGTQLAWALAVNEGQTIVGLSS